MPPALHQQYPLIPSAEAIIHEETKNPEKRSNSQYIVSYCLGLHTCDELFKKIIFKKNCLIKSKLHIDEDIYNMASHKVKKKTFLIKRDCFFQKINK